MEPDCIMDAMQMRPDSSWSATRKNRSRGRATVLLKRPSGPTLLDAFSSAHRFTRTSAPIHCPAHCMQSWNALGGIDAR